MGGMDPMIGAETPANPSQIEILPPGRPPTLSHSDGCST